jgi:hypothetical protein
MPRKSGTEPPLIGPGPRIIGPRCGGLATECQPGGGRGCTCAYWWEWQDGVLTKPPELRQIGGECPVAERDGRPCFTAPWRPVRVFALTANDRTPRDTELCAFARNRAGDEAEHQAKRDAMRCEWCRRPAARELRWAHGCAPRKLPPDVEQWRPHFWSTQGRNDLHMGYICPARAAIEDAAHAEGRSVVVTLTDPPVVSMGTRCVDKGPWRGAAMTLVNARWPAPARLPQRPGRLPVLKCDTLARCSSQNARRNRQRRRYRVRCPAN